MEREELGRVDDMSTDLGRVLLLDCVDSSPFGFLVGEIPSSRLVRVKARLRGRERDRLASFPSSSSSSRLPGLAVLLSLLSISVAIGVSENVDEPLPSR